MTNAIPDRRDPRRVSRDRLSAIARLFQSGFGNQREIELLVEAGFSPVEAIHIATQNGARFLGRDKEIGTLEPGKRADLVLVKGDPAVQIADIENVEVVFKNGVGYDSRRLIDSVRGQAGIR